MESSPVLSILLLRPSEKGVWVPRAGPASLLVVLVMVGARSPLGGNIFLGKATLPHQLEPFLAILSCARV